MRRRRRQQPAAAPTPNAAKRRLLRKVLDLQARKLAAAERRSDAGEMNRIEQRMMHTQALLSELETRR